MSAREDSAEETQVKEHCLGLPFDVEIEFTLRRGGGGIELDGASGRQAVPDLP